MAAEMTIVEHEALLLEQLRQMVESYKAACAACNHS